MLESFLYGVGVMAIGICFFIVGVSEKIMFSIIFGNICIVLGILAFLS